MPTVDDFLNKEPDLGDETYDMGLYDALSLSEKDIARDRLVDCVQTQDDSLALTTLAQLADPRATALARAWAARRDNKGFWARRALVRLGHGDEAVAGLVADLASGSRLQRFGALMDLARLPTKEAFDGLLSGLDDDDPLVRDRALDSLIERFGIGNLERHTDGSLNLLSPLRREQLLLGSQIPPLHQRAASLLKDWFIALQRGVPADQLGLRYSGAGDAFRDRVGAAVRGEITIIPCDDIRAASPHDRAWAEALLAVSLQGEDPRLPAALADLGVRAAVDAMNYRVSSASGPMEAALYDALRRLTP
jgi:hypothetical protein